MKIIRSWTEENFPALETLFRSANGYLDIRNAPEEGPVPGSSRDSHLHVQHEADPEHGGIRFRTVAVPDAQTVRLCADGVPYSMFSCDTVSRIQEIDTQNGINVRTSVWQLPQGTLVVRFTRMASVEIPGLFLHRMQAESLTYEGRLQIETAIDAGETPDARGFDAVTASVDGDEGLLVCGSRGVKVACRCVEGCSLPGGYSAEEKRVAGSYEGRIHPGDRVRLNRLIVYADGVTCADPAEAARGMLNDARQLGGEELLRRQKKRLSAWTQRLLPMLSAPEPLEETLHFSLYQLAQSAGLSGLEDVLRDSMLLPARKKAQCMKEFLSGAGEEADYLTTDGGRQGRRIHAEHLAGAYAAILGIAGVEADEDHFSANPSMPEGWSGYVLPVLWQGRLIRISMGRCGAAIALLSGEPAEITWCGAPLRLTAAN